MIHITEKVTAARLTEKIAQAMQESITH